MGADNGAAMLAKKRKSWTKPDRMEIMVEMRMPESMLQFLKIRYGRAMQGNGNGVMAHIRGIAAKDLGKPPKTKEKLIEAYDGKAGGGVLSVRFREVDWGQIHGRYGRSTAKFFRGEIATEMRKLGLAVGE